jgi:hypothetical protein
MLVGCSVHFSDLSERFIASSVHRPPETSSTRPQAAQGRAYRLLGKKRPTTST